MHTLIALPAVDTFKGLPVPGSGTSNAGLSKKVVAGDERTGAWPAVILSPSSRVPVEPWQTSLAVVARCVVLASLEQEFLVIVV